MNEITKMENPAAVMESVLLKGDISQLTSDERNAYYMAFCKSLGLNPLTKPLEFIVLNGKLQLYALKACTDQLRQIHGVSLSILDREWKDDLFTVHVKARDKYNREDEDFGTVSMLYPAKIKTKDGWRDHPKAGQSLTGEDRANAILKAVTKAKRRTTLSICGLGMLDETEIEDIPAAAKAPVPQERPRVPSPKDMTGPVPYSVGNTADAGSTIPHKIIGGTFTQWTDKFIEAVGTAGDDATVTAWINANKDQLAKLKVGSPTDYDKASIATTKHREFLARTKAPDSISTGPQHPNIKTDYEAFLTWAHKEIASHVDPGLLETWWNAEIETRMEDIFPPDALELSTAYDKAQSELNRDG